MSNSISQQQEQAIITAHAQGLSDKEAATFAGVSRSTVKRIREKHGLTPSTPKNFRNELGRRGEEFVASELQRRGFSVKWPLSPSSPYDIEVDGVKIEVKTTTLKPNGSAKFTPQSHRPSPAFANRARREYKWETDYVILVAFTEGQPTPDAYVFLSSEIRDSMTISARRPYPNHKNRWDRFYKFLTRRLVAA